MTITITITITILFFLNLCCHARVLGCFVVLLQKRAHFCFVWIPVHSFALFCKKNQHWCLSAAFLDLCTRARRCSPLLAVARRSVLAVARRCSPLLAVARRSRVRLRLPIFKFIP